jgi:muramoyltetrapeptide carboxypeptidase LdcA involved in peptidoglycan recycling
MTEFAENGGMLPYLVASLRQSLFSSNIIGEIKSNTDGWTVERLDWADPANQLVKRKLNPSTGWKFLQGHGVHRGHLIGGCLEVFDWTRGTGLFPGNWQDAILFRNSEEAPPLAR